MGPPLQNRNYSITVTRVTVEIDKSEAQIRVPRIEKPLATSFCEKIKKFEGTRIPYDCLKNKR
jgi:hypothetical protein